MSKWRRESTGTKATQRWSAEDDGRVIAMRERVSAATWTTIGEVLGRSAAACQMRYAKLTSARRASRADAVSCAAIPIAEPPRPELPPRIIPNARTTRREAQARAEEAKRQRFALPQRSITAEVLGDPLPGRSALDQRRET